MKNKILICGTGAIGGYFGGRLAQNPDNDVTFLSRGQTYRNLTDNGLIVKSIHGDFSTKVNAVNEHLSLKPVYDYVFICIKLYDNGGLFEKINHLFNSNVIVVTLQNGLSGYDELKMYVKNRDNLLQGICKISSELKSDGIIYHTALGKIITGEIDGNGKDAALRLCKLMSDSSVLTVLSDNFNTDVWVKFAWNAIFNTLTALYMKSTDELFEDEKLNPLIYKLYEAVSEIAETQGVYFGDKEYKMIITDTMNLGKFQTSAYFDRRNGKKTEIPFFLGSLISIMKKSGIKSNYVYSISELVRQKLQ
ncbi:MAG: ketopantoate reductase family protein [Ignavibacteria bacterium]|nr:ketopantoate reductase family protein [Ignavibacteria bacterium]